MNQKTKKGIAAGVASIALIGAVVGGSLAYLQDMTDTAHNAFTVGDIQLTLDETVVDDLGEIIDSDGDTEGVQPAYTSEGNTYRLLPGHTYTKDPTLHIAASSEDCYAYVQIAYETVRALDMDDIKSQLSTNGWNLIKQENSSGITRLIYAQPNVITKNADVTDISTFTTFTVPGTIQNNEEYTQMGGKYLDVTGYAVQSDGFGSAEAAWEATFNIGSTPGSGNNGNQSSVVYTGYDNISAVVGSNYDNSITFTIDENDVVDGVVNPGATVTFTIGHNPNVDALGTTGGVNNVRVMENIANSPVELTNTSDTGDSTHKEYSGTFTMPASGNSVQIICVGDAS